MGPPCVSVGNTGCTFGGCFMKNFTAEERKEVFTQFWGSGDKRLQDTALLGCIKFRPVKRVRTKVENKAPRIQFEYTVLQRQVCRHTFKSLHGITNARLVEILKQKKNKETEYIARPDMRGKSKFCIMIVIDDDKYFL